MRPAGSNYRAHPVRHFSSRNACGELMVTRHGACVSAFGVGARPLTRLHCSTRNTLGSFMSVHADRDLLLLKN